MVTVHMTVGTLVLIAYLALTICYAMSMRGRTISFLKPLSFAAAGLLALQYVLGFGLLGNDHEQRGLHYVFALAALITVGVEHGYAGSREDARSRARIGTIAAAGTFLLALAAYGVGESSS